MIEIPTQREKNQRNFFSEPTFYSVDRIMSNNFGENARFGVTALSRKKITVWLLFRKHFYLEETTAFTNHGSYGTVPKVVMEERFRLLQKIETHTDRWFRSTLRPLYEEARVSVAKYVRANPDNLVFVTNATMGINTIVKELDLKPEDSILCTSHTYNAVTNAVDSAVRRAGADIVTVDITVPIRQGYL